MKHISYVPLSANLSKQSRIFPCPFQIQNTDSFEEKKNREIERQWERIHIEDLSALQEKKK